ncbi:MAG: peptidase [Dechloromonas sp.]|nr:peptidase [Dechloromonas sp.]
MAVVAGACFAGMAVADGKGDHDLARQAVEAGEVLPLSTVLSRLERDYPGQVLAVELERDEERWIYEIKMIRQGGGMSKLKLDARDASLIEIRSKGLKSDRRPKEAN